MKLFNCHTHTEFSHDGKGSIAEIYNEAKKAGLLGFSVTDHLDCEFSEQKETSECIFMSYNALNEFKNNNTDNIIVAAGVEIGEALFAPGFAEYIINSCKWDVILGSVHAVRIKNFEMPFSVIDFSKLSIDFIHNYVKQYFIDLLDTAENCDYDILSHLTVIFRYVIHKYNISLNEADYFPIIQDILKTVIKRNKTLEVNTSGAEEGYIMPDIDILKMYKELGGNNISLGSDSHIPQNLSRGLISSAKILGELGFTELSYYLNRNQIRYTF